MLEDKIKHLIDKHQFKADRYHESAKNFYEKDLYSLAVDMDRWAHNHESIALELRMILK